MIFEWPKRGRLEVRSLVRVVLLMPLFLAGPRAPVTAQGIWTEASTVGYGATAVGLSIGACWSCDYETFGVLVLAAGVGGLILGHKIGGSAEDAARRGEPLTSAQLWGARIGTVTGFAAVGASVAALIINETGGNAEGEDERRLLTYTLIGGAGGVLVEILQEVGLPAASASAATSAFVESVDGRTIRLGLRRSVAW